MTPKPSKVIAVDVDGTLVSGGETNHALIAWVRVQKQAGYSVTLWSMQGEQYARETAGRLGLQDLFDAYASKPRYVVDDAGWTWIRFTRAVSFSEILEGINLPKLDYGT